MADTKQSKVRFCVGSESDALSPVWMVWARRSDVYIAQRTLAYREKVSLHESGVWRIAFTTQSGVVDEKSKTGDRVSHRWNRPPPYALGWTSGPTVVVMHARRNRPIPILDHEKTPGVHWIAAPRPQHKVTVLFLFSAPGVLHREPWGEPIGQLTLANGESVWVVAHEAPMTTYEIYRTKYFMTTKLMFRRKRTDPPPGVICLTAREEMNGQPCFMVVPLCDDNIEVEFYE